VRARRRGGVLALVLALAVASARAEDAAPSTRVIKYDGDALTVHLSKVPVTDVLGEVAHQTGCEIRGDVSEQRDVSAEFEKVPLRDGLARLLGTQNFALIYGTDGRLRAVRLLGGGSGTAVAVTPVAAPAPSAVPAVPPGALMALMDQHAPVPVTGRIAQTLGSETASLRQLFELGLHNEDAMIRREAVHESLQVIESEPELRGAFVGTLANMSDTDMAQFLRGIAGTRAEEFAQTLATQSRVSELRVKASSVLRTLQGG
jgi:hypothetical protein